MLIVTGSTKGGCGKTTISTNLACKATSLGLSTLLIDGDLQKSSLYWRGCRPDDAHPGPQVIAMPSDTIHKDLPKLAAAYDVVIVDVGGRDSAVLRSALFSAGKGVVRPEGGIVLIPAQASQLDAWGVSDSLLLIREARGFTDITARILLTQLVHGTAVSKSAMDTLSGIEGAPLLNAQIHSRVAFKNAVAEGRGVVETEPNSKAAAEVNALWAELIDIDTQMKGAL